MKIALFTDSPMYKDITGKFYPLNDEFLHFISPLSRRVGHLTIISRCQANVSIPPGLNYFPVGKSLSFVESPYYTNTKDFYKRALTILPKAIPIIRNAVRNSDIVILRIHNCLAWVIKRIAVKEKRRFVLYWAGGPVIESVKQNYPGKSLNHIIARKVAHIEDAVNSRIMKKAFLNIFIDPNEHKRRGSPKNVRWVVPNLVSCNGIVDTPRMRSKGHMKVVFAGRLFRAKGIYDLLEAVELLKQRHVPMVFHIAGDGPEKDKFLWSATEKNLMDYVKIEGNLTRDKLQELMQTSDAFTLPTYTESIPKVLWEAWAAGLAVVITDVGGISNFIKHRQNALLIKPGNPEQIAKSLEALYKDENLRYRLAETGIQTAREHTWEQEINRIASALEDVYASVTAGSVSN